jgi:hypothetical protein
MSLSSARAKMLASHRDLMQAWHRVSDSWRDDTARAFEERSIDSIDKQLRAAMNALESMEETLRKVRSECGERF